MATLALHIIVFSLLLLQLSWRNKIIRCNRHICVLVCLYAWRKLMKRRAAATNAEIVIWCSGQERTRIGGKTYNGQTCSSKNVPMPVLFPSSSDGPIFAGGPIFSAGSKVQSCDVIASPVTRGNNYGPAQGSCDNHHQKDKSKKWASETIATVIHYILQLISWPSIWLVPHVMSIPKHSLLPNDIEEKSVISVSFVVL